MKDDKSVLDALEAAIKERPQTFRFDTYTIDDTVYRDTVLDS